MQIFQIIVSRINNKTMGITEITFTIICLGEGYFNEVDLSRTRLNDLPKDGHRVKPDPEF